MRHLVNRPGQDYRVLADGKEYRIYAHRPDDAVACVAALRLQTHIEATVDGVTYLTVDVEDSIVAVEEDEYFLILDSAIASTLPLRLTPFTTRLSKQRDTVTRGIVKAVLRAEAWVSFDDYGWVDLCTWEAARLTARQTADEAEARERFVTAPDVARQANVPKRLACLALQAEGFSSAGRHWFRGEVVSVDRAIRFAEKKRSVRLWDLSKLTGRTKATIAKACRSRGGRVLRGMVYFWGERS